MGKKRTDRQDLLPGTLDMLILKRLLLGIPAAIATSRVLTSLLFGLTPTDPGSLAAAAVLMTAIGLAAAFLPARRAARVDPIVALRAGS